MTNEIMEKMEQRRKCKENNQPVQYKELKHEVQRMCREAKADHYNRKCEEIEQNPLMYQKITELTQFQVRCDQGVKSKDGKVLQSDEDILQRWAEYVEKLYHDDRSVNQSETDEECIIMEEEVKMVIQKLSKNKAPGEDNIPAEFLQSLGDTGLQLITKLMNNIYKTGKIPDNFAKNIFITIPKIPKAQECSDFRTISLISHTSKILLQLIKHRITPIIERLLAESQMGFRKGKGTRDAIFQLRVITQRAIQVKRKIYACFVDYQKAFDRVKHDKLVQ